MNCETSNKKNKKKGNKFDNFKQISLQRQQFPLPFSVDERLQAWPSLRPSTMIFLP